MNNVTLTAKITGYVNVTPRNVQALKIAIAKHGPISVAIDASHKTFSFYSHGVYYDPACGKIYKLIYNFKQIYKHKFLNSNNYNVFVHR